MGEITLDLNGLSYPMKIDLDVIAQFQTETGADFMHIAMKAINAIHKSADLAPLERAEMLTGSIRMDHAAWLFYLAAKKCNSVVQFGEIQEAVLFEGAVPGLGGGNSYPFLFAELVQFATFGILDDVKKNKLNAD